MRVEYPIALDSDYGVSSAFGNRYWPAVYLADAEGRIRYHHFGEALTQLVESRPDLVLIDIAVGEERGLALPRRLG